MRKGAYLLLMLLLLCCAAAAAAAAGDREGLNDDILGLIVLKSGLEDPSSALATWNEDDESPCTAWSYVQCSPATGRVVSLSLDGLALSGRLPSRGLEKLSALQSLSLSRNNLTGPLPARLSHLASLRRLNLSRNGLSGPLPDALPAVRELDLSGNSLSGVVPASLFSSPLCSNLRLLDLSDNALEGAFPPGLARCGFLLSLNLRGNRLAGGVDLAGAVPTLRRLRLLELSDNAFSGGVPDSFAALHNLKELRLRGNRLTGGLPASIGLCTHLQAADLSANSFTGELPGSFRFLAALEYLNISGNALEGNLPAWVGGLRGLRVIDVSRNTLTGKLPPEFGDLKELRYFGAEENELTGAIPARLAECGRLAEVRLSRNQLAGGIPPALFDLGLEQLDLSSNNLAGTIPSGSTRLFETLRSLDLSNNRLTGDIPPEVALFFNLRYLNLSWNDLRSRIPPELGYFRNLSVLDLRYSALYGQIPGDLCESDSLSVLQLDGNSLTGPIPVEIGNCSSLYLLSLSHNNLNGTIPPAMGRLKKLVILNLEFNELGGEIPPELAGLDSLLAANISHNRLVGRLPTGSIFPSLDQSALQGNLGICSPLVAEPCIMNIPKPLVLDPNAYAHGGGGARFEGGSGGETGELSRHRRFLSVSAIVAIGAAMTIAGGVLVVSLLNASARRRMGMIERALEASCSSSTAKSASASASAGRIVLFGPRSNLRSEDLAGGAETLLHKATEIGRGSLGTVYKASLGPDGRVAAVKKLLTPSIVQFHEDFDRELRAVGKARHPNLMPIRGYYWTPETQLLITDYAPNGSLQSRLHEDPARALTWGERFRIALGAAKGLAHLHHSFRPPIVHYNVKPSNVLLDAEMNARVADFGLARLLSAKNGGRVQGGAGALGYVAPEMACRSIRVNEKCDVYGFGVVVLELVTGRRAVEYGDEDVVVLVDEVRSALERGGGTECVDRRMEGWPEEEVMPVMKLGLVCASQVPSSRPTMAEVVQILQVIRTPAPEKMEAF